ncbi:hypothetical protein H6G20_18480 [Desertifilum sp. FACHB-1129]|uniref:Uncharacterized protein n=2 Tax=Desertifilum tharense IPPAS B-1220 TaxID=1781255 RepID=A0A1E5QM54_9CYAN|nr:MULTISPECIES: hypothetical protein [Desertifilum]MDA0213020.1 hypothetical protein [Cyanobacteria bacterium FC1]MBD2313658.1 hypothetical protein [Desertifilum sp. FACHB-1129]MBD2324828.1 hypothetical protein [Desertifilum sp. FACHB-866]MBD2334924.1 hypothetical protein [Desertifilum sp. FACHB-868]OEJ75691.1 hypothetical protein BH720_07885 [Desertifilum tharense IPPAS B-1220]
MESISHNPTQGYHWQLYKRLELISSRVPDPRRSRLQLKWGVDLAWRSLLNLLVDELIEEQQVEYLERCWALDESKETQASLTQAVKRLWRLME